MLNLNTFLLPSHSHGRQIPEEYWQAEVHIPSFANYLRPRRRPHLQAPARILGASPDWAYHSGSTRPFPCAPLTNTVIGRIVMVMAIVLTGPVTSGTIQVSTTAWCADPPHSPYAQICYPPFHVTCSPIVPLGPGCRIYLPVYAHVTPPHDRPLVAVFVLRIRTCSLENKNQSWNEPKFSFVYFLMAVAYGYTIRAGSPCGPLAEVYPFFSRRGDTCTPLSSHGVCCR